MSKYWSGLFAAGVIAATATVAAQGRNPATTPPPDVNAPPGSQQSVPAPAAQGRTQNTVTISGCLENAPAVAASAPGRGSTAAMAGFVLANPQLTASGRTTTGGAVGTTGVDANTSYRLEGEDKLLSPHLNHQVRITGTLQSSAASATGAERAAGGSTAAAPTLKVESVEMVAETCVAANTPSPATPRAQPAQPAEPARPAPPGRGGPPTEPADPAKPADPAVPPER